jgi:Histidine kinase-, DNA gyrase B-, and HSP90-like ATPase
MISLPCTAAAVPRQHLASAPRSACRKSLNSPSQLWVQKKAPFHPLLSSCPVWTCKGLTGTGRPNIKIAFGIAESLQSSSRSDVTLSSWDHQSERSPGRRHRPRCAGRRGRADPDRHRVAGRTSDGDRVLLERRVSNLIDNAVKHNVTGGWVLASTRTEAGIAELTIANGGEHTPADQVTGLFEPFRRLSGRTGNRPGSGLGLSIVASVAKAHGGRADAHTRPGGGLDVQITLPATANGRRAALEPQTAAPLIWQPDHHILPAADQGHATAGQQPGAAATPGTSSIYPRPAS